MRVTCGAGALARERPAPHYPFRWNFESRIFVADAAAANHHQLRVIDESGEDYLYPEEYFIPVQLPEAAEKAVLSAANLTPAK